MAPPPPWNAIANCVAMRSAGKYDRQLSSSPVSRTPTYTPSPVKPRVLSSARCGAVGGTVRRTLTPIVACGLVAAAVDVAVAIDGRVAFPVIVSGDRSHATTIRTSARVPDLHPIGMATPP